MWSELLPVFQQDRTDSAMVTARMPIMTASDGMGPTTNQWEIQSILTAAKKEDGGEAEMQKAELFEHASEQEEERTQTHDGEDVGRVGDEKMARDGEHGGDGIEREDDVGDLDGEQGEKKHGDHAGAVFSGEEDVGAERNGVDAGDPTDPERLARGVGGFFFLGEGRGGWRR